MKRFIKENAKHNYISKKPKKQQLYLIFKLIMNRKRFQFNFKERMAVMMSEICFCFKKRKAYLWAQKNQNSYNRGVHKLTTDLDVNNIIERTKRADVVNSVNFNPAQRFLIQFNKGNVIHSDSESSAKEERLLFEKRNWKYFL